MLLAKLDHRDCVDGGELWRDVPVDLLAAVESASWRAT